MSEERNLGPVGEVELVRMRVMCAFTVATVMKISLPISALVRPCPTATTTSCSRGLSAARAARAHQHHVGEVTLRRGKNLITVGRLTDYGNALRAVAHHGQPGPYARIAAVPGLAA